MNGGGKDQEEEGEEEEEEEGYWRGEITGLEGGGTSAWRCHSQDNQSPKLSRRLSLAGKASLLQSREFPPNDFAPPCLLVSSANSPLPAICGLAPRHQMHQIASDPSSYVIVHIGREQT